MNKLMTGFYSTIVAVFVVIGWIYEHHYHNMLQANSCMIWDLFCSINLHC